MTENKKSFRIPNDGAYPNLNNSESNIIYPEGFSFQTGSAWGIDDPLVITLAKDISYQTIISAGNRKQISRRNGLTGSEYGLRSNFYSYPDGFVVPISNADLLADTWRKSNRPDTFNISNSALEIDNGNYAGTSVIYNFLIAGNHYIDFFAEFDFTVHCEGMNYRSLYRQICGWGVYRPIDSSPTQMGFIHYDPTLGIRKYSINTGTHTSVANYTNAEGYNSATQNVLPPFLIRMYGQNETFNVDIKIGNDNWYPIVVNHLWALTQNITTFVIFCGGGAGVPASPLRLTKIVYDKVTWLSSPSILPIAFWSDKVENNREKYTTLTADAGVSINSFNLVDTASAIVNIILPPAPLFGEFVEIIDLRGTFAINNCIIDFNGKPFNSDNVSPTLTLDYKDAHTRLVYTDSTVGWKLVKD